MGINSGFGMIRYTLTCANDHGFDSWFQSAEAFERLAGAGMLSCGQCGSTEVSKTLMAPNVRPARNAAKPTQEKHPLAEPQNPTEAALVRLRREIEEKSDYVGLNFAAEARAMHEGDQPERSIYGEARAEDARKLIEDGVPVAPLPFMPVRRTN
jgi:hypothetical protein